MSNRGHGQNEAFSVPDEPDRAPDPSGRGPGGRFAAGSAHARGRRTGRGGPTITSELHRQLDPVDFVARLIDLYESPKTDTRSKVQIAAMIADRLEGKSIARSITAHASASQLLPANFDRLSPGERLAAARELRARARAGELTGVLDAEVTDEG